MAEYARRAFVELVLDGYPVSGDFAPYLLDFTYAANASGKADEIQLTLHNRDGRFSGEWLPKKGMAIEASIICADWEGPGESLELPCGTFKIDELDFTGAPDKIAIKAVSADLTGPLRDTKKTRAWENFSLAAIAAQIASENSLELYYSGPEHRFERQDQRNEADIAFLNRLAGERSMNCKVHQGRLVLFDADSAEKAEASLVIPKTGGFYSPASYSFKLASAGTDYTDAEAAYSDPKTGTTHKARVKSKKDTHSLDSRAKTLTVQKRAESAADAASLARSELHAANVREQTASVEIIGCPALVAGQMVALEGFGVFSGSYFVKTATHKISGSGKYSTALELQTAAPVETESAHDEVSEPALAAKEEVSQNELDRKAGIKLYPPGEYPLSEAAQVRLLEAAEKVSEFIRQAQSGTEEDRINAERDWLILDCLKRIVRAYMADLPETDPDYQGWLYLSDMLQLWPSGYASRNADDAEEALFVTWKWLYSYERVKSEYKKFVVINDDAKNTIFNEPAQQSLGAILFNDVKYDDAEKEERMKEFRAKILPFYTQRIDDNTIEFDFIHSSWKHWEALYYTLRGVPGFSFGLDGLAAAFSSFSLRALASGHAERNDEKWLIHVEKVAVFGHDKFNFEASDDPTKDELGFWDCHNLQFYVFPPLAALPYARRMNNGHFGGFRERHGFGADFLVLSQLHLVENFTGKPYEYPR